MILMNQKTEMTTETSEMGGDGAKVEMRKSDEDDDKIVQKQIGQMMLALKII